MPGDDKNSISLTQLKVTKQLLKLFKIFNYNPTEKVPLKSQYNRIRFDLRLLHYSTKTSLVLASY